MAHGHAHEEAEHVQHAAHDPFDRRVAITMVVVAAVLAAVKVQGHRTHNNTLSYQIKSNVAHTQASDLWSYYQHKKNRQYMYEADAALLADLGRKDGMMAWAVLAEEGHAKEAAKPKKKKGQLGEEGRKRVEELVRKGLSKEAAEQVVLWREQARQYKKDVAEIETQAKGLQEKGEHYEHDSEHKHHQAFYFDMGELGVELALVLCSVAILTKRAGFWFGGIGVGLVGVIVVALGFLAH
jgi:hypothetical protein